MTVRDPRTGRFVATANAPESSGGKFNTYTEMPVEIEGADPAELAYDAVPRYAPDADDLAQGGQWSPLRARNPVLVHPDDEGHHNAIMRTAARNAGPMDPSAFLTGLVGHTAPSMGIQEADDDDTAEPVRGGLRPVSRGQGRGRRLPSLRDRS